MLRYFTACAAALLWLPLFITAQAASPTTSPADSLRFFALEDAAYGHLGAGRLDSFVAAAEQLVTLADGWQRPEWQQLAYNALGNARVQAGRLADARSTYRHMLDLMDKNGLTKRRGVGLMNLGVVDFYEGNYPAADSLWALAQEAAAAEGDTVTVVNLAINRGGYLKETGAIAEALEMSLSALDFAAAGSVARCQILANAGVFASEMGFHERSVEFSKEALSIARAQEVGQVISVAYNNLGLSYHSLGQADSALHYLQLAEQREADPYTRIHSYLAMTSTYRELKRREAAFHYANKAVALAEAHGYRAELAVALDHLAAVYHQEGDAAATLRYLERANALYTELGTDSKQELKTKERLLEMYEALEKPIPAGVFTRYRQLRDSIFAAEREVAVARLTDEFNVQEARAETAEREAELTRSRARNRLLGLGLGGITVLAGVFFWGRNRQRRLAEQLARSNEKVNELYRELHHRTNNNLAHSIGLLQDRIAAGQDPSVTVAELQTQLHSMVLLQQLLGRTTEQSVSARAFFSQLVASFEDRPLLDGSYLTADLELADTPISPDFATNAGFILTELLLNTAKYGSRSEQEVPVTLRFVPQDDKGYLLYYADQGAAAGAKEGDKAGYASGQGTSLIDAFTRQASGRRQNTPGYSYAAYFPVGFVQPPVAAGDASA